MSDVDTDRLVEHGALGKRIKWLIGLRLLLAVLFLGSATILTIRERLPFTLTPLFVLAASTCLLSVLYLLLLSRSQQLRRLCGVQLWIDSLLVTALVHYTGGIDSVFAFVYIFPILAAAICLSRQSSLLLAGASSILYGVLINIQLHQLMERAEFHSIVGIARDPGYALFQTFVNAIAFFVVALLGSHLAERLKETGRELEERRIDLRYLQSLHRDIVANIPSGVMTLDLEGRIVSFNPTAQKILGLAAEEIQGKSWRDTPFQEIMLLEVFFSSPTPSFEALSQELEVRRHDGHSVLIGISLTPLKDSEGELLGLVGIFQDLTERRQIEARLRQADRLAAVGQLAAGLAHEVRNPLAAISGSIQLMKEEGSAAPPYLLDIVLRETDRLKLVTGQFLDFAYPRQAPETQCDLVAVLEETVVLLEKRSDVASSVDVSFQGVPEPVVVAADPDQLKQVLWNLSLNAIQAMPGGGRLTFDVRRHVSGNGTAWAAIELTDTGPGIPSEEVDRIFDPFYTTKPGGTGLGLAIAQKIIDNLGGRIEVVSREGDGTTFKVYLKQAPGEGRTG
ncbi:MAG: PAS domain S-box protein [Candidatus Methylomirabilis oxyfera]|nr:PAS domain S-box protein [Candidatus Methylomirabilis oxyfera]